MRLLENSKSRQVYDTLKEDFWNPGKYFNLLVDMYDDSFDAKKWNESNQEERDAMVLPILKDFWNKYKEEMTEDDIYALFNDLEDNNYHTEYRLLRDIIYNRKMNESSISINESFYEEKRKRLIKTGLKDEKSRDVLNAVVGQLSDGIWENSPGMERFWRFTDGADTNGNLVVYNGFEGKEEYNGIDRYGNKKYRRYYIYSAFNDMDDDQVKRYYAHKIKQIVKEEGLEWNRNNTQPCEYLDYNSGVTVRDAYRVYDKLLGRIDRIKEGISYKDDKNFEETVKRDFRLFLMDKYGDELYKDVTNGDVNEYFSGMFYDIEDEDDLDAANEAEDIIRTTYHVSDTDDGWDRDEEYDDGDTNWAAEEAADADERFENRYMGGGNGSTFSESVEEVSFDEIETRMANATTYDELYAAINLIQNPSIRVDAEQMLQTCERDGDDVETAYSVTTTEYIDPYRNDENVFNESVEEHDLSKDLFGDEAANRMSQKEKDLERDLQYVRDIMAGKTVIDDKYHEELSLDTAKAWLRKDFVYVNGLSVYSPDEINKRLADEYPDIFSVNESAKTQDFINDMSADQAAMRYAGITGNDMTLDQYQKYQEYLHNLKKNDTSRYDITISYWDNNGYDKEKSYIGRSVKEIAKKFTAARDKYDFKEIVDWSDNLEELVDNSTCVDLEEYLTKIYNGEPIEELDEGVKLSPKELVSSAYKHVTSDLGKEATVEAVLDYIVNNYDQNYFKGNAPGKEDFYSVRAILRSLGLIYSASDDIDENIVGTYKVWSPLFDTRANINVSKFKSGKRTMYAVDNPFNSFEWSKNFYKTEDGVKRFLSKHDALKMSDFNTWQNLGEAKKPTDEEYRKYKQLLKKASDIQDRIRNSAGSQSVMLDDIPNEYYDEEYSKRVYGYTDEDIALIKKVDNYIDEIYDKSMNESKKPKAKKEEKRVIMQQGNVTCFKENDSTYYVFENEHDNEVEFEDEGSAMKEFMERVGVNPDNELTEDNQ